MTDDFLDLVFSALSHENRFVREANYYLCGELTAVFRPPAGTVGEAPSADAVQAFEDRMAPQLARGLADNWSQVCASAEGSWVLLAVKSMIDCLRLRVAVKSMIDCLRLRV